MSRTLTLSAAVTALLLAGTALSPASAEEKKLDVVASFSIIADLAKNVGGDRVDITTLVGPNGDAHVYEPRPADAAALSQADVILANGLQLEGFLPRLIEASGTTAPVVELTKGGEMLRSSEEGHDGHHGAAEDGREDHGHDQAAADAHDHGDGHGDGQGHDHDHEGHDHAAEEGGHSHDHEETADAASAGGHGHHHHGEYDPHAWQSVANAKVYVANIADAFCAADEAGCTTYRANAEAYDKKLDDLDAYIRRSVAEIPETKRAIITSHDAFGYFEHEYGIDFLAPEGVSTESEASAADVAALVRQIRADDASAVFVENVTNPRLIEQIASETGLKVGGELYSDALSDGSGPASTYIDMMRHNIDTIKSDVMGS
ncbi:metal ABC transporter substrate-binding protein [Fulvimarina endophytica]|uniref:Metal ABC transporter substrate-binding protein n=1 Tax=Fulvimarina endophytica TaxID=2293836 RepID=A0A371X0I2_9HYPH|nr:zinc ABC transporter substrate-binding protein [Fulvimarina endophytica]RFC62705.1 metal ABC transporter substrate-binding protein [Fulvimarina endophytica]